MPTPHPTPMRLQATNTNMLYILCQTKIIMRRNNETVFCSLLKKSFVGAGGGGGGGI